MKRSAIWIVFSMICFVAFAGCPKKETVKPVEAPPPPPVVEKAPEPVPDTGKADRLKAQAEAERMLAAIKAFEAESIYFEYDKYNLRAEARAALDAKAAFLKKRAEITILIEGHCDERGTVEYNLALGERRAAAAKTYLVDLGISPYRIQTVTYGEEHPVDPGRTEKAWAKNRRCQFAVASDAL